MTVSWVLKIEDLIVEENSVPVAIGLIIDVYFTYCLKSCYLLGKSGKLDYLPKGINPSQDFVIVQGDNTQNIAAIAEDFQEAVAYPVNILNEKNLPEKSVKITKDFTLS